MLGVGGGGSTKLLEACMAIHMENRIKILDPKETSSVTEDPTKVEIHVSVFFHYGRRGRFGNPGEMQRTKPLCPTTVKDQHIDSVPLRKWKTKFLKLHEDLSSTASMNLKRRGATSGALNWRLPDDLWG